MIAITEDCNLNCKYCYNQDFNRVNSGKMPLSLITDIIDEASNEGVQSLCITGGEPTQHEIPLLSIILIIKEFHVQ